LNREKENLSATHQYHTTAVRMGLKTALYPIDRDLIAPM
jgi:hypothetical protein